MGRVFSLDQGQLLAAASGDQHWADQGGFERRTWLRRGFTTLLPPVRGLRGLWAWELPRAKFRGRVALGKTRDRAAALHRRRRGPRLLQLGRWSARCGGRHARRGNARDMLKPSARRFQTAARPNVMLLLQVRDVRKRLRQVKPVPLLVWAWGRMVRELERGKPARHATTARPQTIPPSPDAQNASRDSSFAARSRPSNGHARGGADRLRRRGRAAAAGAMRRAAAGQGAPRAEAGRRAASRQGGGPRSAPC